MAEKKCTSHLVNGTKVLIQQAERIDLLDECRDEHEEEFTYLRGRKVNLMGKYFY